MRYCVLGKQLSSQELESECRKVGARNISPVPRLKQVFCDLEQRQVDLLVSIGLSVKEIRVTKAIQITIPAMEEAVMEAGLNLTDVFSEFRSAFTPPLTGIGLTVAVLDSGVRKTHQSLVDKVVYEENFSDSETVSDIYGHGTSIAYLIAGGMHGDIEAGVAPGAKIMNLKCLNDDGEGTDEMVIKAIDKVCELVESAEGIPPYDPMYPNIINLSIGGPDDGDPDNPVRAACRTAVVDYGLQVLAAAGNDGPDYGTVMLPACDPDVVAVGGIRSDTLDLWEKSSRGPAKEGYIKPDFVAWSTSLLVADSESNEAYAYKTGTSFAVPILAGLIGLIWELGRRNFGDLWYVSWYDVEQVGEMVCVKPQGAPYQKDNDWGYGVPAPGIMTRGATGEKPITTTLMELLPLVFLMGMMGVMIRR